MYDGEGGNLRGPPLKIRPVLVLSGGYGRRVDGDTPKYAELCQTWPPLGTPPPKKTPKGIVCISQRTQVYWLARGGVPGKGSKIDKYTGALRTTTPAGHGVDPRVGKPPQYVLIPMWDVFPLGVPQRLSP